jgi:hypothetical protein
VGEIDGHAEGTLFLDIVPQDLERCQIRNNWNIPHFDYSPPGFEYRSKIIWYIPPDGVGDIHKLLFCSGGPKNLPGLLDVEYAPSWAVIKRP